MTKTSPMGPAFKRMIDGSAFMTDMNQAIDWTNAAMHVVMEAPGSTFHNEESATAEVMRLVDQRRAELKAT